LEFAHHLAVLFFGHKLSLPDLPRLLRHQVALSLCSPDILKEHLTAREGGVALRLLQLPSLLVSQKTGALSGGLRLQHAALRLSQPEVAGARTAFEVTKLVLESTGHGRFGLLLRGRCTEDGTAC
jgi:hypothetical protein